MRVGIIGAGLAGLAAGLELADRGHQVEVLERRPWAGGATYSFPDDETGDEVDNGQHLFMECTSAYRAFLQRLGTLHLTYRQERLHVPVFDPDGRRSDLWSSNLPLGLHLAPALLRYRHLSWRQKLEIARAFLALRLLQVHERGRLERITFEEWLRERKQSPDTIREFWDFLVIPTLNCRADEASASQSIFVLEEGFQKDSRAAALAVPATGLSKLHVEPAIRAIEERGGKVAMRAGVECVRVDEGRVASLALGDGECRTFDAYVSALAPWRLLPLLPEHVRGDRPFADLAHFEPAPILNLHLWFDRPVLDFHCASFIRSEVQWAFNRSRLGGEDESETPAPRPLDQRAGRSLRPDPGAGLRARPAPVAAGAAPRPRGQPRALSRDQGAGGDLRARSRALPPRPPHAAPQLLPGGLVYRYGLARHHGIGRSKRSRRGSSSGGE